jgi:predicted nucleic acid-binding protein
MARCGHDRPRVGPPVLWRSDDRAPPRFTSVAINDPMLDDAARLAGIHELRACDAVQLASAKAVAQVVAECRAFVAFDSKLRTSAAAEGFALIPV